MDSVSCKASARGFPFKRSLPSRPLGRGLKGRRQSCQRWGSTLGVLGPIATLWRSRLAAVEAAEALQFGFQARCVRLLREPKAPSAGGAEGLRRKKKHSLCSLWLQKATRGLASRPIAGFFQRSFEDLRRSGEVAAGLKTGKFLIGRLRCPRNMTRGRLETRGYLPILNLAFVIINYHYEYIYIFKSIL